MALASLSVQFSAYGGALLILCICCLRRLSDDCVIHTDKYVIPSRFSLLLLLLLLLLFLKYA
jgi:hypothetical protein